MGTRADARKRKEEATEPKRMTTYKRADGEMIGEFGWVGELDWFDDDGWATALVEEQWERVAVRAFTHHPSPCFCDFCCPDEDEADA